MIITSILWAIIEFFVLYILILKTEYYKNLKNLCDSNDVKSKISSILIKNRKKIRVTIIIGFTILAPICNILLFRVTNNICSSIKFLIAYCMLSLVCITDFKKHIVPNNVLITVIALRIIMFLPEYLTNKEDFKRLFFNNVLSFFGVFVFLLLLSFISKGSLGMGDVKLFSVLGLLCGIYCVLNTFIFGLLACSLVSIVFLFSKFKSLKDKLAFGPFIFIGFIITIIMGAV